MIFVKSNIAKKESWFQGTLLRMYEGEEVTAYADYIGWEWFGNVFVLKLYISDLDCRLDVSYIVDSPEYCELLENARCYHRNGEKELLNLGDYCYEIIISYNREFSMYDIVAVSLLSDSYSENLEKWRKEGFKDYELLQQEKFQTVY